jgi:hypothetical protein
MPGMARASSLPLGLLTLKTPSSGPFNDNESRMKLDAACGTCRAILKGRPTDQLVAEKVTRSCH